MDKLIELQNAIAYKFINQKLLKQALSHKSYGKNNYERLEFVGDGILDYTIALELYNKFIDMDEGSLSKLRARLVNQETLVEIAKQISLGNYLFLGDGEEKSNGRERASILADCLEALFAAISIDSNIEESTKVIKFLYKDKFKQIDNIIIDDYKSQLQEHLQAKKIELPSYNIKLMTGPDHEATFHVECNIEQLGLKFVASAKTKKEASQLAAKVMLETIKERWSDGK
jgi:ribonuclease-3